MRSQKYATWNQIFQNKIKGLLGCGYLHWWVTRSALSSRCLEAPVRWDVVYSVHSAGSYILQK